MVHRRLQEGLLAVHGSIEDAYETGATPIHGIVGTFEPRCKHEGRKNDDSYKDGDTQGPNPCDCWHF